MTITVPINRRQTVTERLVVGVFMVCSVGMAAAMVPVVLFTGLYRACQPALRRVPHAVAKPSP